MLFPIFLGYDYRFLIVRNILYLLLIFLIFGAISKLIINSNSKYLKGVTILCIVLLGINSFKDGICFYYKVDVYPKNVEDKYLVSYNGLKIISLGKNEYRYRSMPVIHKFYLCGIFSTTSDYTFEHRLEDGSIILAKDGVYSLIQDGDDK